VLIGILAFQIAFVDRAAQADQQGHSISWPRTASARSSCGWSSSALSAMACGRPPKPLGPPRERDDRKRAASQIESAIKAVVCLVLAVVALRVVTGSGNGGQGGEQATAKLLQMPGGQVLVALAGVVIVAAAVLLTSTAAPPWMARAAQVQVAALGVLQPGARQPVIAGDAIHRPLDCAVMQGCILRPLCAGDLGGSRDRKRPPASVSTAQG